MKYTRITLPFALILALANQICAESWRGIVPLRSTRTDVERVLGKPLRANEQWMVYEFLSETVLFSLITEDDGGKLSSVLPRGTIHHIEIIPKRTLYLPDIRLDETKIAQYPPLNHGSLSLGFEGYVDENAGLIVRTSTRRVTTIFYFANATDRKLCPACYPDPKVLADIPICTLCPTVSVTSPEEAHTGERIVFTANVEGTLLPLSYKWSVSIGNIVEGQGTTSISVTTNENDQQVVVGTVEVEGIDPSCNTKASSLTKLRRRN